MNGSSGSGTEISDSLAGSCAVVLRGVEAQGLDVPQQGDPLVQPRLRPADGCDTAGTRASANRAGAFFAVIRAASASTCQAGRS